MAPFSWNALLAITDITLTLATGLNWSFSSVVKRWLPCTTTPVSTIFVDLTTCSKRKRRTCTLKCYSYPVQSCCWSKILLYSYNIPAWWVVILYIGSGILITSFHFCRNDLNINIVINCCHKYFIMMNECSILCLLLSFLMQLYVCGTFMFTAMICILQPLVTLLASQKLSRISFLAMNCSGITHSCCLVLDLVGKSTWIVCVEGCNVHLRLAWYWNDCVLILLIQLAYLHLIPCACLLLQLHSLRRMCQV